MVLLLSRFRSCPGRKDRSCPSLNVRVAGIEPAREILRLRHLVGVGVERVATDRIDEMVRLHPASVLHRHPEGHFVNVDARPLQRFPPSRDETHIVLMAEEPAANLLDGDIAAFPDLGEPVERYNERAAFYAFGSHNPVAHTRLDRRHPQSGIGCKSEGVMSRRPKSVDRAIVV